MDGLPPGLVITSVAQLRAVFAQDALGDVGIAVRAWREATLTADKQGWVDGAGTFHEAGPDHPTRIKAADYLVKFHGAYPEEGTGSDPSRPVAVVLNLTGAVLSPNPGNHLSSHGVVLHLDNGERNGA